MTGDYGPGDLSLRNLWWRQKPGVEMAHGIMDHFEHLRLGDAGNEATTSRRYRLAAQRALVFDRRGPNYDGPGERKTRSPYPVLDGASESVHAKITTTRPRPQVISVGGRWKHGRKAKLLQRWIDGYYDLYGIYEKLSDLVQDGMMYDSGWIKVYAMGGRVCVERVWDGDIYVDRREERFGPVRTLYHALSVDRYALIERFPSKRREIMASPASSLDDTSPFPDLVLTGGSSFVDHVTVVEAYRLPPGGDTPGKFAVAIAGRTSKGALLVSDDYKRETFPFVPYVWARDPERFRGRSFVEKGAGIQQDLDDHEAVVREAMGTFVPRWSFPRTAHVKHRQLGNHIGIIEYDGMIAPTVLAPPPVSPEFLRRGEQLKQRVYHVTGASELEATAQVKAGLNSGRAILAHQDVTSIRFATQGQRFEKAGVELARLILDVADSLAEDKSSSLKVYGIDHGAELIDYRDVRMDRDSRVIRVYPASKLPDTIAGRLEIVGQMMQEKIIVDPLEARRLLDMPDLERAGDLASAKREYAEKVVDECLDGKVGIATKYMDLPFAIEHASMVYVDAVSRGGEEDDPDAMQCLRDFIGSAMGVQAEQQPPPGLAAVPPGMPPPAGAGAPPPPMPPVGPDMAANMPPAA